MSKKKVTLNEVKTLTEAADEAARQAAKIVRPAHAAALDAARGLRDDLGVRIDERTKVQKLVEIIESSVTARETAPETATAVLGHYLAGTVAKRATYQRQQRDGGFLIASLARYSKDFSDEQRRKLVCAMSMACKGLIDPGLAEFPPTFGEAIGIQDAEALASLMDGEAYTKFTKSQEKLTSDFIAAQRYVDALEQATPLLSVVVHDGSTIIGIRNNRGGSTMCKRIRFEGDAVTTLTAEEFSKVREHWQFQAKIKSGEFEITNDAVLAEAV